jgi:hypothetical protein
MQIEIELPCELLAYLSNFGNNRVFDHGVILPLVLALGNVAIFVTFA